MNLKKLAVMATIIGGMAFTGATAANAESQIIVDCVEGYEAVYNADQTSGSCEPIATTEDATSVDGCWTNADGTDVCARTGVVQEPMPFSVDETPVPVDVNETPVPVTICSEPADCPEIMMDKMGDGPLRSIGLAQHSSNDSMLLILGLITAVLGAAAIVLNRMEFAKK